MAQRKSLTEKKDPSKTSVLQRPLLRVIFLLYGLLAMAKKNLANTGTPVEEKDTANNSSPEAPVDRHDQPPTWKPSPGDVKAKPEILPEPSIWPFMLAFGVTFIMWGLIANWIILAGGTVISVIALAGWIAEILKEATNNKKQINEK